MPSNSEINNHSTIQSTKICRILLWIWYYYFRNSGMVALRLSRNKNIISIDDIDYEKQNKHLSISYQTRTHSYMVAGQNRPAYQVYIPKYMLGLHIFIRIASGFFIVYGILYIWQMHDFVFSLLAYFHISMIVTIPIVMIIVEILNRTPLKRTLNSLLLLLENIEALNENYGIFQWTHVGFVAVKILMFVYEIIVILQSFVGLKHWAEFILIVVQSFILIEIWLNIHVMTLLYLTLDALYGSLNHYIRNMLIMPVTNLYRVESRHFRFRHAKGLSFDIGKFIELYQEVQRVGLELHRLWQIPLISTMLSLYFATLHIVYFMIYQYIKSDNMHLRFIPYVCKMAMDIWMLSLASHRAIKSSRLIVNMGLEKAELLEHGGWHLQMEKLLFYMNLNEFKLNLMGLFDISNASALTFTSGILTSISIFIPFTIKIYRIQVLMENPN